MKQIHCPINGLRPLQEFSYGGELRAMPDPANVTDAEWANYVFNRDNAPQTKLEWWRHTASGTWFIAERNTMSDEFIRTGMFDEIENGRWKQADSGSDQ